VGPPSIGPGAAPAQPLPYDQSRPASPRSDPHFACDQSLDAVLAVRLRRCLPSQPVCVLFVALLGPDGNGPANWSDRFCCCRSADAGVRSKARLRTCRRRLERRPQDVSKMAGSIAPAAGGRSLEAEHSGWEDQPKQPCRLPSLSRSPQPGRPASAGKDRDLAEGPGALEAARGFADLEGRRERFSSFLSRSATSLAAGPLHTQP